MSAQDLGSFGATRAVAVDRGTRGGALVLWNNAPSAETVEVGVAVPPGVSQAWLDAHINAIADDDTYGNVHAVLSGGQAVLQVPLAASTCAQDGLCRIGGAPVIVIAPSMPRLVTGG